MEKSALFQLLQSFSVVEKREIRKFLNSPFFNQRSDVIQLFEAISVSETARDKAFYWHQLFGDQEYEDQKMRLLMSYLHRLVEQFVSIREMTSNELDNQLSLAVAYRKRKMQAPFERIYKDLQKALDSNPLRDLAHQRRSYQLNWERYQLAFVQNPTDASLLFQLSEQADTSYLIQKLQILCLLTAHQSVYQGAYTLDWAEDIVRMSETLADSDKPAIRVYLQCYRMLKQPEQEEQFHAFKAMLFEEAEHFAEEEIHSLYVWALNHCVRRLNAGDERYYVEALDMYKEGLNKSYLLENGLLSRFAYHNIVASGLHTGELEWVRFFIHEYKNRLEKKYRDSSFSFNLARLEYANQNYDVVLDLLQSANYRDPLLNLAAKTLLLKIYFETEAFDLLQSHLDAMRNYINRKHVIGYHRNNYLNIIRYTEKMMRLNLKDRVACVQLWETVKGEKVLTEKAFFRKWLGAG